MKRSKDEKVIIFKYIYKKEVKLKSLLDDESLNEIKMILNYEILLRQINFVVCFTIRSDDENVQKNKQKITI